MGRPVQCTGDHGVVRRLAVKQRCMPSDYFADILAGMIWDRRWLAIALALSFTGLACLRTPMDEQRVTNTIGPGGGVSTVTSGGSTGTVGGTGGITGAGGNKCTTDQNTCVKDDDCTNSDYRPPISSAADCYCFVCGYSVSKTMAVDCQSAYDQFCGLNWQLEHGCEPPSCPPEMGGAACVAGMCQ
jgi:hypothetical protein